VMLPAGLWRIAALQLLAVYAVARLLELFASAVRLRAARLERGARPPREPWYGSMVLLHVLVFAGCAASVLTRAEAPPFVLFVGALVLLALAAALRGWVFWSLRGRWNVRVVDPGDIVTTGPYRYIRHPNYLVVIVELVALPLVCGSWTVALLATVANAIVLSWRIPFEERELSRAHPTYRTTMMGRPRFLPFGNRNRGARQSTIPL
jgi:methyltransferase